MEEPARTPPTPLPKHQRRNGNTVTFSVFHDEERDISPKLHVVEIPIEKCWTVSFVLTATDDVYVSHTAPTEHGGGTRGQGTNLGPVGTDRMKADGIYQLEVSRRYGHTTPSEVTVSYRVGPPPASYQCDPADQ